MLLGDKRSTGRWLSTRRTVRTRGQQQLQGRDYCLRSAPGRRAPEGCAQLRAPQMRQSSQDDSGKSQLGRAGAQGDALGSLLSLWKER